MRAGKTRPLRTIDRAGIHVHARGALLLRRVACGVVRVNARPNWCAQVDWDLASVGAPGVTVSVALLGSIGKNLLTGCWNLGIEISIGISFGLSMIGGKLGLGIGIVGSLVLCPRRRRKSCLAPPLPQSSEHPCEAVLRHILGARWILHPPTQVRSQSRNSL